MDNDWIKDYRKSVEWGWYKDVPTCHLFFHLLRRVNWKKGVFHGREILPGGMITSVKHLSFETGLTIQQVRTALIKLKSTNEITYETTNTFTHIQVQNWDKYQDQSTSESTNQQQTDNKRITTIEEGNKERKKETETLPIVTEQALTVSYGKSDINDLIQSIKAECLNQKIEYGGEMEREFSKHILTAKEFGLFCERYGKERAEMAIELIKLSCTNPYLRGTIIGPKSIYKNYAKVINSAQRSILIDKEKKENPNLLVI